MKTITENLNEVFGVENCTTSIEDKQVVKVEEIKKTLSDIDKSEDINEARNILKGLLRKGESLLDESIILAKESQAARSFEVSSNLIKVISEVAKDLIDIHGKDKTTKTNKEEPTQTSNNNTQNNVFIGTTADLSRLLKDMPAGLLIDQAEDLD